MSRFSPSNPPVSSLVDAISTTATSLTVPNGTFAALENPTAVVIGNEQVTVVSVTTGSPEVWTVVRGVGTVAEPHSAGDPVEKVYTTIGVRAPLRNRAVGVSGSYTPAAGIKYHFLTLSGATTIGPPADVETTEVRFVITQPATAQTLSWSNVYNLLGYTAPARSSTNSVSFAYNGLGGAGSWVRIQ